MEDVTVVTVTYNSGEIIEDFLNCLRAQRGVNWALIVVDNNSQDNTRNILSEICDQNVHIVYEDANTGVAAASNRAIALAKSLKSSHLLLINNDVVFGPLLLLNLIKGMRDTGASAISPTIAYYSRPDTIWYAGGSFKKWRGVLNVHENEGRSVSVVGRVPFQTEYAPTTCLMMRPSIFDTIGQFDERFFLYWEDVDLLWRMRRAGHTVCVDPRDVLLHKVSVTSGGPLSKVAIHYSSRNQIFFARKHHGEAWARYTAAVALLAGCARVVLRGDGLHHLTARWRAIHEGFRMPVTADCFRRPENDRIDHG